MRSCVGVHVLFLRFHMLNTVKQNLLSNAFFQTNSIFYTSSLGAFFFYIPELHLCTGHRNALIFN